MEIKKSNNKDQWDQWAKENGASFLQSHEWGEILIAEGKEVERLAVIDDGEVVAEAQVVFSKLHLGMKYGFCPAGPAMNFRSKILDFRLYELLAKHLESKNCIFFRYEPSFPINQKSPPKADPPLAEKIKNQKSLDMTPRATSILDLAKSDDELLAAMHEKTRYNIRLAERKDLKIEKIKDFDSFWKLMKKTGARDDFKLHGKAHYKIIFGSDLSKQLTVYAGDEPVAVAIFVGFGDTFTYLFGASDHAQRSLMAPYSVQWEGIKLGKKLGYKKYDFFGITPPSEINIEKHQYAGVTRFKLGFGGSVCELPGTHDLIISPLKYRIYKAMRALRRLV